MFTTGFALVIGLWSIACAKDDSKKDKELLQGGWQVISWVDDGVKQSDEIIKYVRWTFSGDKAANTKAFCINNVPERQGGTNEANYKILREKGAKVIELTTTNVNGVPVPKKYQEIFRGIYSLDGDTLKCAALTNAESLPTKFESAPGSSVLLIILTRIK